MPVIILYMAAVYVALLAFVPQRPPLAPTTPAVSARLAPTGPVIAPRSGSLIVSPMSEVTIDDMRLQASLPQHASADASLRMLIMILRIIAGAGASGVALHMVQPLISGVWALRSMLTCSTIGTVRAADGLLQQLLRAPTKLTLGAMQHASLMFYYPLDLWRAGANLLPQAFPAAPFAVCRCGAAFWFMFISSSMVDVACQLRVETGAEERRVLHQRLRKLVLDAPIAITFFFCIPTGLLLSGVGVLGLLSSLLQLALAQEKSARYTLSLPVGGCLPRGGVRLPSDGRWLQSQR